MWFSDTELENIIQKLTDLQGDLGKFRVEFLDRDGFIDFIFTEWRNTVYNMTKIRIMGYFSETMSSKIQYSLDRNSEVRIITQELNPKKLKDKKNLQVLQKLAKKGAEIKLNNRVHARYLWLIILLQIWDGW